LASVGFSTNEELVNFIDGKVDQSGNVSDFIAPAQENLNIARSYASLQSTETALIAAT
jgi:hypothetical protein